MKKIHNRVALFVGIASLVMTSIVYAGSDMKDMTKEDLYNMILELKQEVQQLKAEKVSQEKVPAADKPAMVEKDIKQLVQRELEMLTAEQKELAERLEIHASLSQGFLYSDKNNWMGETSEGSMEFNEFTLNFSGSLTDKLRGGIQLMSRDLGEFANNNIQVDWANIDYSWKDELGFRAGILKNPSGLYNASRDIDAARIGVLLPQGFYSENARELANDLLGVSVYGDVDLRQAGSLSYSLIYGNSDLDDEGETASLFADNGLFDVGGTSDVNIDKAWNVSLFWTTPLDGLLFNFTYQNAQIEIKGLKTVGGMPLPAEMDIEGFEAYSFGAEYTWEDFFFAAEYRKATIASDYFVAGVAQVIPKTHPAGWYVLGGYRFNDWFASEVSYSEYWSDEDNKDGLIPGVKDPFAYQKIVSLNARFDINEYWIVKAGVSFNKGLGAAYAFQNDVIPEEDWILYQLKTTVSF